MTEKFQIQINDSTIGLALNELWYFYYYLKDVSSFYDKTENRFKKIMIVFPGTSLRLVADREKIINISDQVKSYVKSSQSEFDVYNNN